MAYVVEIRAQDDRIVVVFGEDGHDFDVSLSVQTAALLIAGLAQAAINRAEPNQPNTPWRRWRPLVQSADVSFDIDTLGNILVGMAIKLSGLMPVIVEIPPDAARQVAFALNDAAERSRAPEINP